MKRQLQTIDITKIKYSCRPGMLICMMMIFTSSLLLIGSDLYEHQTPLINSWPYFAGSIIFAFLILFLMNRGCYLDLKKGYKTIDRKTIQKKESKIDFEAGSGKSHMFQKMNSFNAYYLIIENTRYRVKEELFNTVEMGSSVSFELTAHRKHRLAITKSKS